MDPKQIRFVTRTVADPTGGGLRLLPFALWILAAGGAEAGWWPMSRLALIGLLLPAAAGVWAAHRHYQRTYGEVVAGRESCGIAGGVTAKIASLMALAIAVAAEIAYAPDPSVLGLTVSGITVAFVFLLFERPKRIPYAAVATVVLLGFLLAPRAIDVPGNEAVFEMGSVLFDLYMAFLFGFAALVDHALVARTLRPVPDE